jgi:erythromycin esterase
MALDVIERWIGRVGVVAEFVTLALVLAACAQATPLPGTLTTSAADKTAPALDTPTVPAADEPLSDQEINVSPEIGNWLRENAIPFNTTEPGSGFDDLMPLKEIIGDARIVALGEATHGTREFFQMKHRMLEFLVKEMGFNIFAIEATWPEANLVNDYVHTGEGDPAELLKGLYFWTWNTQEVLDMIRWMQAHNENPGDAPPVNFFGFDMQFPRMAMDNVVEYLQKVDPAAAEQADTLFDCFHVYTSTLYTYADAPSDTRTQCRENLREVHNLLSQRQTDYEPVSSPGEFTLALQSARVVQQAEDVFGSEDPAARDRYMAENVAWLLDQAGVDAKVVLWAHNGHVGMDSAHGKPMGACLREQYGDEMVIFGFTFYSGSFNAIEMSGPGQFGGLTEYQIALPPEDSYEYYFRGAELPRLFLDLRGIQPGSPATDWLLEHHPFRSIGAVYNESSPSEFFQRVALPQVFDVVIYFQDTTSSLLLGQRAVSSGPPPVQPTDSFQPSNLGFETGTSGWEVGGTCRRDYGIGTDSAVLHSGHASGYISSIADGISGFGTLMQTAEADEYQGQRVRMSAYVKTEGVEGWAGLWLRVDGPKGVINIDNMQDRPIQGDTDWTQYEIVLDVPEDSINIAFGILVEGTGQAWVDDLQFEVVGQDVPTAEPAGGSRAGMVGGWQG